MRLLQLIFYFTIGYLLWRLVRSVLRTLNKPTSGASQQSTPSNTKTPSQKIFREEEIKDAEFEDITPPSGTSSKTSSP